MWEPNGKPFTDWARLGNLDPVEVLLEYDGPRIFTCNNQEGDLLLAFQCSEDDEHLRFVLAPFNDRLLGSLTSGKITLRNAILQPQVFLADVGDGWRVKRAWKMDSAAIPKEILPKPGTMLWPHLEPILRVRAVGDEFSESTVPLSVLRAATQATEKTLRLLAEQAINALGMSERMLRRYFDLPTRVAYSSLEVSFQAPDSKTSPFPGGDDKVLKQMGELLQRALGWATNPDSLSMPNFSEQGVDIQSILEAVKCLTPSSNGRVEQVFVSGRIIRPSAGAFHLTTSTRKRINRGLRRVRKIERLPTAAEIPSLVEGYIREVDKDSLSFTLRGIPGQVEEEKKLFFYEELLDDVNDAFNEEYPVRILARPRGRGVNRLEALTIEPNDDESQKSIEDENISG